MGPIILLQCNCGFADEVCIEIGWSDPSSSHNWKRYFVYDKKKNKLSTIKSYERLEIDGFISESEIMEDKKILCPYCNSGTLESDMVGLWD